MASMALFLMNAWGALWFGALGGAAGLFTTMAASHAVDTVFLRASERLERAGRALAFAMVFGSALAGALFGWSGGFERPGRDQGCGGVGPFADCR